MPETAGEKLSAQTLVTPTSADFVYVVQSGNSRRATVGGLLGLITKATLGLGNLDNTSDANKPISTAQQAALDGKAAAGAIGSSGLTMTAGILGRESGTGAPQVYSIGSGLSIVNGALTASGVGGGYPALSMPTGFSVTGSGTASLVVTFAAGYSLPTTASQSSWNTAATLASTAVQEGDARLSDAREWSAATVTEADAVAGISTVRRAWTVQRVWQAAEAWWQSFTGATGRSVVAAATQAQARSAIGAGTSSVAISSATPQPLGTAAAGSTGQAADAGHVHAPSPVVTTSAAGLAPATGFGSIAYAASVALDLAARDGQTNTITLSGDLTFTTSNLANGRTTGLRLIAGGSSRTLTFPVDWQFVSTKPASIPAGKTAKLSIECYGTTNADVLAGISIQP